jgi:hypothetical protein
VRPHLLEASRVTAGNRPGSGLDRALPARYAGEVSMLVKHAKAVARQWVIEEASNVPGFHGAYFAGSTNWLPDDAALPAISWAGV